MGEFRKYRPYYACNALRFNSQNYYNPNSGYSKVNGLTRVPNFRDISGIEYGWLKNLNGNNSYAQIGITQSTISGITGQSITNTAAIHNNYQTFIDLTPFATSDKLADYSMDDYDYRQNMVGKTYFQKAMYVAQDVNKILYSMSIFNDNIDSYVANDDPIFVADTFYSLIDGNYILLTTEPSDWSTNYTEYYKLVPAEDIKVSCIKFRTYLGASDITDRSYENATINDKNVSGNTTTIVYAILCAYFLDEEVTIHPGESYLLSLSFESSQF